MCRNSPCAGAESPAEQRSLLIITALLDHIDVLVLNNDKLAKYDYCKKCIHDFAARGGKVVGFKSGVKLLPPGGVACKAPCSVVKEIRKLFQ